MSHALKCVPTGEHCRMSGLQQEEGESENDFFNLETAGNYQMRIVDFSMPCVPQFDFFLCGTILIMVFFKDMFQYEYV